MDAKNRFHTRSTYALARAEHIAVVVACGVLTLVHAAEIDWFRYLASFWIIDVVGYLPGAIAYRRSRGVPIAAFFHTLYNVAHTYLAVGVGLGVWMLLGGPEWAMLGPIIHLSIDRGVFGNIFKPRVLPFEPAPADPPVALRELGLARGP